MGKSIDLKIRVKGTQPKELELEVICAKGVLSFDFEDQKLSMPADFKSYCKECGAVWAIFLEAEIKSEIQKYLHKLSNG